MFDKMPTRWIYRIIKVLMSLSSQAAGDDGQAQRRGGASVVRVEPTARRGSALPHGGEPAAPADADPDGAPPRREGARGPGRRKPTHAGSWATSSRRSARPSSGPSPVAAPPRWRCTLLPGAAVRMRTAAAALVVDLLRLHHLLEHLLRRTCRRAAPTRPSSCFGDHGHSADRLREIATSTAPLPSRRRKFLTTTLVHSRSCCSALTRMTSFNAIVF